MMWNLNLSVPVYKTQLTVAERGWKEDRVSTFMLWEVTVIENKILSFQHFLFRQRGERGRDPVARVHAPELRGLARLQRRPALLWPRHHPDRCPLRRVRDRGPVSVKMLIWFVVRKTKASELKLGFGSHVLDVYRPSPLAENEQRLEVGEIIPHPRYSR